MLLHRPRRLIVYCSLFLPSLWVTGLMAAGIEPTLGEEGALAAYAKAAKALGTAESGEKPSVSEAAVRFSEWATNVGWIRTVQSGQIVVDVDANSGVIRCITNKAARTKSEASAESRLKEGKGFAPTRLPKEVIDAAEKFCLALGQRPARDVRLRVIQFDEKRGVWDLGWARYIDGYLFDEEGVGITIDDQTGDLLVYLNSTTTMTCNTEVRVSATKALSIARDRMTKVLPNLVGNEPFEMKSSEEPVLYIVYANDLLGESRAAVPAAAQQAVSPHAHLVYAVRFDFSYVGRETGHRIRGPVTVWVDAASGMVIGGRL